MRWILLVVLLPFFHPKMSPTVWPERESKKKKSNKKKRWQSKIKDTLWTLSLFITFVFFKLFFVVFPSFLHRAPFLRFARFFCPKFVHALKIKRAIYFIVVCNFTVNALAKPVQCVIFCQQKLLPLFHCIERVGRLRDTVLLTSKWWWWLIPFFSSLKNQQLEKLNCSSAVRHKFFPCNFRGMDFLWNRWQMVHWRKNAKSLLLLFLLLWN